MLIDEKTRILYRRPFTRKDNDMIRKMFADGLTDREMAVVLGVRPSRIERARYLLGLKRPPGDKKVKKEV